MSFIGAQTPQYRPNQSRYHLKQQKQLIQFLITSFGYDKMLANLLVAIHDCSGMGQLMSLFVLDDDGKYPHLLIPHHQMQVGKTCRVCGEGPEYHTNQVMWEELSKYQELFEKVEEGHLEEDQVMIRSSFSSDEDYFDHILQQSNAEQKLLQKSNTQTFICVICYGNYTLEDEMVVIDEKKHEVCLNCMSQYLKQQILNLRIEKMSCPHCQDPLNPQTIKQYTSTPTFEKYQTFSHNLQIQKDPNFKWCPNPKCSIVISISKAHKKILKCPKCSTQICIQCNREAHPKLSCDDVVQEMIKDLENAKDIQKCKKCKALVQKIAGCNHMTCGVCRYQWCWLCGATYSDVHFSPLNPLGCAGMQNRNMSAFPKCKIYFLRILMVIAFLILLPILGPLTMLFCGPVLLFNFLSKRVCYTNNCCFLIFQALLSLPLGIIADPFIWIAAVIIFLPKFCNSIANWFQKRREMIEASQNQIKRRLLEQGEHVMVSQS